jgi:hypothetical protein
VNQEDDMRRARATAISFLVTFIASCTSVPSPPVTVLAAPGGLDRLAGDWRGEYWSVETGRKGSIHFDLDADTGAAWGDVWMVADASSTPGEENRARGPMAVAPLRIRFVRVTAGGDLSGTIEPYQDPGCGCLLSTTFTGAVTGDLIQGTYTSRGGPLHEVTTGQWQARRAVRRVAI